MVDACIANAVQALWDAGLVTLGSCCGHGRMNPSLVIENSVDAAPFVEVLNAVDGREWVLHQWQLVTVHPARGAHTMSAEVVVLMDLLGIPGEDWWVREWDEPFEGNVASFYKWCSVEDDGGCRCVCCDPENLTPEQFAILSRYLAAARGTDIDQEVQP